MRSRTRRDRRRPRGRRFEPLESRLLLAGDLGWPDAPSEAAAAGAFAAGEGEAAAPDLAAFAQALRDAGVKLYGAAGSAATTEQKALLEDGAQLLAYVEAANPDGSPNQTALDQQIVMLPTWELPNGARQEGVQTVAALSQWSGVPVPVSDQPFIAPLPDVTLRSGSPLHIALDGYDPDGQPLTYTVESSDPLVAARLLDGNASWRITVDSYGDLVAQLFDGRTPRLTERIKELTSAGFYNGLTFHRVMDGFVVQGGDPNGDGTGGSSLPDFDNQFASDAQHNRTGMFSFANRGDNTNNSQFFITDLDPAANPNSERSLRYLDFNHPVFAVLVEGYDVLEALTRVPTTPDSPAPPPNNAPLDDLVINSAEIFTDPENGVALLSAPEGSTGDADITVTATDADGNQFQQTFHVTVVADPYNGSPFLLDPPPLRTHRNEPITVTLQAEDVEGDTFVFGGSNPTSVDYTGSLDGDTGELTITPPQDFVGVLQVDVAVQQTTPTDANDPMDRRRLSIEVAPDSPAQIDLLPESDSGADSADDLTNHTVLQVEVTGVSPGALVSLVDSDGTLLGQADASSDRVVITTSDLAARGDGPVAIAAVQTVNGVDSDATAPLVVTIDTQIPEFTTTPPFLAPMNSVLTYDVDNPEEGQPGFFYSLVDGPDGAWLHGPTGLLTWVPTASQTGMNRFSILAADAAGNSLSQAIEIDVTGDVAVRFRMETTDISGAPISSIDVGEDFLLRVFVEDSRLSPTGVFAAYLDVVVQNGLAEVIGDLEFSSSYHVAAGADLSTGGLINEAGGAANKLSPLGAGEFPVFTARLRAIAAGDERFVGDAPDESPLHDVLLFGQMQATPFRVIDFGEAGIHIHLVFGARDDAFAVDEDDAGAVLDVLANDQVLGGESTQLTIVDVGPLENGGAVSIADDGKSLLYEPAPDFFGEETFTYQISDGDGKTDQATVTVAVLAQNDPPTAAADHFTVVQGAGTQTLNVLLNDSATPDQGETLKVAAVGQAAHGADVTIAPDGAAVLFTPAAGFLGTETFAYTLRDSHGAETEASVSVEVVDYAPRQLTGSVVRGGGRHSLGGVPVTLRGTDLFGDLVERTVSTGADGGYHFDDLPPGQYTISQDTPMFLVGGGAQVSVASAMDDGDSAGNNFAAWSRRAEYISLLDFLSPKPDASILAAVSRSQGQLWYSVERGWSGFSEIQLQLSEDASSLQLTVVDPQLNRRSAVVPLRDPMLVDLLAHEGDAWLIRLRGDSAAFDFHSVEEAAAGEAPLAANAITPPAVLAPPDPQPTAAETTVLVETSAEGEPASHTGLAPTAEGEAAPQQATLPALPAASQEAAAPIVNVAIASPATAASQPAPPRVGNTPARSKSSETPSPSDHNSAPWFDVAEPMLSATASTNAPSSLLPDRPDVAAASDVEAAVDFLLAQRGDQHAPPPLHLETLAASLEQDAADFTLAVDAILTEEGDGLDLTPAFRAVSGPLSASQR